MRRIPALFLPLLLVACGHEPPPPVTGPRPAPYVVEAMAPGETGMELRFSGRIEGINETVVTARTAGTVSALPHEIGDRVPAGAIVVRLRSTEQRSSAAQAEAAVRAAAAQATETALRRSRIADMQARQVVAKATLDTAVAADEAAQGQLAAAQAAREAAREGMAYTAAAAPYAAIITDRPVRLGDTVSPGTPLFSVMAEGQLRLTVDLPAEEAATLRSEGTKAVLHLASGPMEVTSSRLFPVVDGSSGTVRAWFNLPRNASNALAGTSASIGIRLPNTGRQTQPSLSVPRSALVERDEVTGVYVWEASTGRTRLRQVRAGQPQATGRISILAGLAPGDQVAVDASAALRTLQQSSPAGAAP